MGYESIKYNKEYRVRESRVISGGQMNQRMKIPLSLMQCCKNPIYLNVIEKKTVPLEQNSFEYTGSSIEESHPTAYIINAILSYKDIAKIPSVIDAMLAGLVKTDKICIVLGINAPSHEESMLNDALREAVGLIGPYSVPIALIKSTFSSSSFPFGEMRNAVLQSEATREATEYFVGIKCYPYVSFQDFDTSSRLLKDGTHVFNRIDQILHEGDMDDFQYQTRPLMIGGGYRPQPFFAFNDALKCRGKEVLKENEYRHFETLIERDMKKRDKLAKIHPLIPYVPEPNLFVDAVAVYKSGKDAPTAISFGRLGAEYTAMAGHLHHFAARELDSMYRQQFIARVAEAKSKGYPVDERALKTELEAQFIINIQNNRHPLRESLFYTDFQNLSIETDLSRLEAEKAEKCDLPQTHTLGTALDRMYNSGQDKRGISLKNIKESFMRDPKKLEYLERIYMNQAGGSVDNPFIHSHLLKLGGGASQNYRLSLFGSLPSDSFLGAEYPFGILSHQKPFVGHQLALLEAKEERFNMISKGKDNLFNAIRMANATIATQFVDERVLKVYVNAWLDANAGIASFISFLGEKNLTVDSAKKLVSDNKKWDFANGSIVACLVASALGVGMYIDGIPLDVYINKEATVEAISGVSIPKLKSCVNLFYKKDFFDILPY